MRTSNKSGHTNTEQVYDKLNLWKKVPSSESQFGEGYCTSYGGESLNNCDGKYPELLPDVTSLYVQDLQTSIKKEFDELAHPTNYPPSYSPEHDEQFDFIIVGGGSAGSVLANRLSEISDWRVLLIEAGGNPTKTSEVPALTSHLFNTHLDWNYKTNQEENCCIGFVNNSCLWPRGKVLGGSSSINLMLYVRGNKKDYDDWEKAGNIGWGYKDVLPFFKKSEDMRAEEVLEMPGFDQFHGRNGFLKVESWSDDEFPELESALVKSLSGLGYGANSDCNGDIQTGYVRFQGTIEAGKRCSTAKAFLSPIKDRKNLKVAKFSLATKLLIHKDNKTCYGIQIFNRNKTINVRATKEVVLSAGALNSPQLLLLSGIGKKEHLSEMEINNVVEGLPVGENLQDHPLFIGMLVSINKTFSTIPSNHHMSDFLLKNSGRFSTIGSMNRGIHINTADAKSNYADVQILKVVFTKESNDLEAFLDKIALKKEYQGDYLQINSNRAIILMAASLLKPKSRGKVLLQSNKPTDNPTFISGYFSDPQDINTIIHTYQFVEKLIESDEMKKMDAQLHKIKIPLCDQLGVNSKQYWECYIRHFSTTTHHMSGTCKMGPIGDPSAVVNPTLHVYGLRGLRVADASILPTIPSGNTLAPVVMVAEKASDMIKQDWI